MALANPATQADPVQSVEQQADTQVDVNLGKEVQHLSGQNKQRYVDKLNFLAIRDPYLMPTSMFQDLHQYEKSNIKSEQVPDISHEDIFHYCVDK